MDQLRDKRKTWHRSREDILVVLGSSELLNDGLGVIDHGSYFLGFWRRTQLLPYLHLSAVLNETTGVQRRSDCRVPACNMLIEGCVCLCIQISPYL